MSFENEIVPHNDVEDFAEELTLEFDGASDPEAVGEWNGESWQPVDA